MAEKYLLLQENQKPKPIKNLPDSLNSIFLENNLVITSEFVIPNNFWLDFSNWFYLHCFFTFYNLYAIPETGMVDIFENDLFSVSVYPTMYFKPVCLISCELYFAGSIIFHVKMYIAELKRSTVKPEFPLLDSFTIANVHRTTDEGHF